MLFILCPSNVLAHPTLIDSHKFPSACAQAKITRHQLRRVCVPSAASDHAAVQVVEAATLYQSFCSPAPCHQDGGADDAGPPSSPGLVSNGSPAEVLAALAWAQHCTPGSQADVSVPGVHRACLQAHDDSLNSHALLCLALPCLCLGGKPIVNRADLLRPPVCQSVTVSTTVGDRIWRLSHPPGSSRPAIVDGHPAPECQREAG